jgi:hypothetical protein
MYASHQMLRVRHDEWLRYAEMRRLVRQAKAEPGPDSCRITRRQRRLRALRLGRPAGSPRHARVTP